MVGVSSEVWRAKRRGDGKGAASCEPPLHQLGNLGSAVSSPRGVRDGAPAAEKFLAF